MFAGSYPLLDAFLTMLWFFGFVLWIWLVIAVFMDIFRSPDLHGGGKAAWCIIVIILPLIGVLAYLIARGGKMHQHAADDAARQQEAFASYVRGVSGDGGPAAELAKLAELRDKGTISQEEFEQGKARILA